MSETYNLGENLPPARMKALIGLLAENDNAAAVVKEYNRIFAPDTISEMTVRMAKKTHAKKIDERRLTFLNDLASCNMSHRSYRLRLYDEIAQEAMANECIPHTAKDFKSDGEESFTTKWVKDWHTALAATKAAASDMAKHESNAIDKAKNRLEDSAAENAGFTENKDADTGDETGDNTGFGAA